MQHFTISRKTSNTKHKTNKDAQKLIEDQIYLTNLLKTYNIFYVKGKINVKSKKRFNRKKFSPEEDEKLIKLAATMNRWEDVANEMPGRNERQCRDRYKNYLRPGYFSGQWTTEEDKLLQNKFKEYGPQWSKIKLFFQNRNTNSLKNRWNYISKHLNEKSNDSNIFDQKKILNDDNNKEEESFEFFSSSNDSLDFDLDDVEFLENNWFSNYS